MYWEIFLADFVVFRVLGGISRDFAEMPEFRGSATARNIRSPVYNALKQSAVFGRGLLMTVTAFSFLCKKISQPNFCVNKTVKTKEIYCTW